MTEDKPRFDRTNWIPIVGYYLSVFQAEPSKRHLRWPVIYSILLAAFIIFPLFLSFSILIPWSITIPFIILSIAICFFGVVIISAIETKWVRNAKDPNNDKFKKRGWDQLAGKSKQYIFAAFIYFNYQEMALAAFGLCYGVLVHTLF